MFNLLFTSCLQVGFINDSLKYSSSLIGRERLYHLSYLFILQQETNKQKKKSVSSSTKHFTYIGSFNPMTPPEIGSAIIVLIGKLRRVISVPSKNQETTQQFEQGKLKELLTITGISHKEIKRTPETVLWLR